MRYDRMGFPMDYQGTEDVRSFLSDQQRRHELEELLTKVDDKNVCKYRIAETSSLNENQNIFGMF